MVDNESYKAKDFGKKHFSFILIFINITIITVLIENIRDKRPYNK